MHQLLDCQTSCQNSYDIFNQILPQIAPDWRQALKLKKTIEDRITKGKDQMTDYYAPSFFQVQKSLTILPCLIVDGIIGIGIAATAVGLLAGGLAAVLSRKK